MEDFDARWKSIGGGEQSEVRRAARGGRPLDDDLAPLVVEYARRRLRRWWVDLGEIAPAIVVLLALPFYARRDLGLLTAENQWPARIVGLAIVVAGFVVWRRRHYKRAIELNAAVPGEP